MRGYVLFQVVVALSLLPSHVAFTVAPVAPRSWHAAAARPLSSAARLRGAASVVLMKDEETANPHPHPHSDPNPNPDPIPNPNPNQVGSRLQKAKDEAKAKAEDEEDSLYATGDFEFDVTHALASTQPSQARACHRTLCPFRCRPSRSRLLGAYPSLTPAPTPTLALALALALALTLTLSQAVTVTALLGAGIAFQFFVLANL